MLTATTPAVSNRRQQLLAALLEKVGVKRTVERIPRRSPGGLTAPLSSGQQRLWFLDRMAPGNPVYNVPMCFRILGPVDIRAFTAALNEIIRRHEILRTTFATISGDGVQVVAEELRISPIVTNVASEAEANMLAIEEARRPFDLAHGPLIRLALFRLRDDDHLAVITMHHIVCDGWSMGVLFREFGALYHRGASARLQELPIQYADYSIWQRDRLASGKLDGQIGHWREHLRHLPATLELPADRSRPQQPSFGGALLHASISPALTRALLDIAQSEDTTPFALLLAAYATLLYRYSGQSDVIVGCPIANRNRAELEPLIGFLPNTLPLRADLSGDPTFIELLQRMRQTTEAAFANADAPFEAIAAQVGSRRSAHNPLFQVAFMMQDQPPATIPFGEIRIIPVDLDLGTAKCDLTLVAANTPGGLSLAFEYSADLFGQATIQRLSVHFKTLLQGIAANPERPLSQLSLLSAAEERQTLVDWNRSSVTFDGSTCAHELFEQQVNLHPNAPALIFGHEVITYSELNRRANGIARALQTHGVGPDALVAIALPRSWEMIATILGVLKAGGAYLPLALDHPAERMAFLVEDARPMMLATLPQDRDALPKTAKTLPWIDISAVSGGSDENLGTIAQPANLAYVIYTSGSTGRPKGAMLEHRGLSNLASAQQWLFELGPGCRVLQFAPPTFDASVWEIVMALASGSCLCLGSGSQFLPDELARVLREQRVTTVTLPPSILRTLSPTDFPDLRTVISAGEHCPEALMREWSRTAAFFNAYGPTETTVCATVKALALRDQRATIGRPIANTRVYILDAHMRPVPVGAPGEMYIGGAGVARGYLSRPELTEERFVPDPFVQRGNGRLYRTGDLARHRPDGEIEFLGRMDSQIKIRGHRIEPGEIESRLERHLGILQSAVVVREKAGCDPRLVAYFVPRSVAPTSGELRTWVADILPAYMVPSGFVPLTELPVNASGKVDRRALAELDPPPHHAQVPARDKVERRIAGIFAEVLGIPEPGVTDNFFELGGNSMLAMNLISRISALAGFDLPLTTLFQAGTIEQIAGAIRNRQGNAGGIVPLQPHGVNPALILIHPAGGTLMCYHELAQRLGPHQPVYGIESEPATTVEETAARYIEEIRRASLTGPYRLGGWSTGGAIAFEMARQLAGRNEHVDLVLLLDSYAVHDAPEPDDTDLLKEIARFTASIETSSEQTGVLLRRFRANIRAARVYMPAVYRGRVALMRASESRDSEDHGWAHVAPELETYVISGSHQSLLTPPHVAGLANAIKTLTHPAKGKGNSACTQ